MKWAERPYSGALRPARRAPGPRNTANPEHPSTAMTLAVPAYQYPPLGPMWRELALLPPGATVVVNPATGPGRTPDPVYVTAVANVRAAGIAVLGYVDAAYGRRHHRPLEEDVERHRKWYDVGGIFIDQVRGDARQAAELRRITSALHELGEAVAVNPGQPQIAPALYAAADLVVEFEGPLDAYNAESLVFAGDAGDVRRWHLVYDVPDARRMAEVVELARRRGADALFITDGTLPNPWDHLPPYWRDERRLIETGSDT
jgi:hypothetical protein